MRLTIILLGLFLLPIVFAESYNMDFYKYSMDGQGLVYGNYTDQYNYTGNMYFSMRDGDVEGYANFDMDSGDWIYISTSQQSTEITSWIKEPWEQYSFNQNVTAYGYIQGDYFMETVHLHYYVAAWSESVSLSFDRDDDHFMVWIGGVTILTD